MNHRANLILELNNPTEVTALYDSPLIGEGRNGKYFRYTISTQNRAHVFFATPIAHEKLKHLHRGDSATLTKIAIKNGNKVITDYKVVLKKKVTSSNGPENRVYNVHDFVPQPTGQDLTYNIMLESLRDAVAIAKELDDKVDVNKTGLSLFIARSKSNKYNYGG